MSAWNCEAFLNTLKVELAARTNFVPLMAGCTKALSVAIAIGPECSDL